MDVRCSEYETYSMVFPKFSERTPVNAVALSVLIVLGMPLRFMCSSINCTVVSPSVVLQKLAAGDLLYRSIESKILSVIGPEKSIWISSFSLLNAGNWFVSVLCKLGLMFLPDILHGMHPSHFFCIASVIFGHQKCLAAMDILLMAGWFLWRRLITVVLRFFGTIIRSS